MYQRLGPQSPGSASNLSKWPPDGFPKGTTEMGLAWLQASGFFFYSLDSFPQWQLFWKKPLWDLKFPALAIVYSSVKWDKTGRLGCCVGKFLDTWAFWIFQEMPQRVGFPLCCCPCNCHERLFTAAFQGDQPLSSVDDGWEDPRPSEFSPAGGWALTVTLGSKGSLKARHPHRR